MGEPLCDAADDLFIPLITLDRTAPAALSRQIHRQIASGIPKHPPKPASPQPAFCRAAELSPNTVIAAYEELAADGSFKAPPAPACSCAFEARPEDRKGLRRAIRAAHYPSRTAQLPDPDGNPLSQLLGSLGVALRPLHRRFLSSSICVAVILPDTPTMYWFACWSPRTAAITSHL